MRTQIIIEIDVEIKERLEKYAWDHGWYLDEFIRYILGESHAKFSPLAISRPLDIPGLPPLSLDKDIATMINAIASTGMCKCRGCLSTLSVSDIKAGKCSKCEQEL